MIKACSDIDRVLVAKINEASQDQVFACWDRLTPEGQSALLSQLHALDMPLLRKLLGQYLQGTQEVLEARVLTPAQLLRLPRTAEERALETEVRAVGEDALRRGRVGIVTAGDLKIPEDQETVRGLLPVGPVSGKTLFQLHAEKVRALSRRYRTTLPWIIATSAESHEATLACFREAECFGLNRADVLFIRQDALPVVNRRGKILLAEPGRVAMSPNGHGGVLLRLISDDVFNQLDVRRLEHLFYFQVDNPLVRIADPVFLGHHLLRSSDLSSKAVEKVDPQERVGTFCQFNGCLGVVDHNELSEADKARREPGGSLELALANVGIHLFSMSFLRRLREERHQLPYHFVERKTAYVDRKGCLVTPRSLNSIQFECFIFDALPLARSMLVLETRREDEFSPVRGLSGADSVITARRDLSRLYARWLRAAGAEVAGENGCDPPPVEISPLYALDEEELKSKVRGPLSVGPGFHLE